MNVVHPDKKNFTLRTLEHIPVPPSPIALPAPGDKFPNSTDLAEAHLLYM